MLFERTPLKRKTTQSPHARERICKYLFGFANLIKWTFETHKVDDSKYNPEIFDVCRLSLPIDFYLLQGSILISEVFSECFQTPWDFAFLQTRNSAEFVLGNCISCDSLNKRYCEPQHLGKFILLLLVPILDTKRVRDCIYLFPSEPPEYLRPAS